VSTYNEQLKLRASETVPIKVTSGDDATETLDLQTPANRDAAHIPTEDPRMDMITVGAADSTVTIGYTKIPTALPFAEWGALR
jgi:hypothetical protein